MGHKHPNCIDAGRAPEFGNRRSKLRDESQKSEHAARQSEDLTTTPLQDLTGHPEQRAPETSQLHARQRTGARILGPRQPQPVGPILLRRQHPLRGVLPWNTRQDWLLRSPPLFQLPNMRVLRLVAVTVTMPIVAIVAVTVVDRTAVAPVAEAQVEAAVSMTPVESAVEVTAAPAELADAPAMPAIVGPLVGMAVFLGHLMAPVGTMSSVIGQERSGHCKHEDHDHGEYESSHLRTSICVCA